MKYVIHAKSEKGFWQMGFGWVFNIKDATQFTQTEKDASKYLWSKDNDAEWIVAEYDE